MIKIIEQIKCSCFSGNLVVGAGGLKHKCLTDIVKTLKETNFSVQGLNYIIYLITKQLIQNRVKND